MCVIVCIEMFGIILKIKINGKKVETATVTKTKDVCWYDLTLLLPDAEGKNKFHSSLLPACWKVINFFMIIVIKGKKII